MQIIVLKNDGALKAVARNGFAPEVSGGEFDVVIDVSKCCNNCGIKSAGIDFWERNFKRC